MAYQQLTGLKAVSKRVEDIGKDDFLAVDVNGKILGKAIRYATMSITSKGSLITVHFDVGEQPISWPEKDNDIRIDVYTL